MFRNLRFDLVQSLWHVTGWHWLGRLTTRLMTADLAYLTAREEAAGREIYWPSPSPHIAAMLDLRAPDSTSDV